MSKHVGISEADFLNLANQTGIDPDVIRSWYKEFILECPNGKMKKKHFFKFYKMLRGSTHDENLSKIVDHVFACFDKDSNGYLDFSEFIISYSSTQIGDVEKKLELVFSFYDKDKNGFIDSTEFLKVIKAIYDFKGIKKSEYPPEKCLNDVFKQMDGNNDKIITKEEFINGCLENKNIMDFISPFEI